VAFASDAPPGLKMRSAKASRYNEYGTAQARQRRIVGFSDESADTNARSFICVFCCDVAPLDHEDTKWHEEEFDQKARRDLRALRVFVIDSRRKASNRSLVWSRRGHRGLRRRCSCPSC
jgi:hypothetical protein